jgi:PPOX class probable F420-dependent enzyme
MEAAHPAATVPTLSDEIRTYLEAPRYATLATLSADGVPHQAVIWYALDGDSVLINSRRGRHWPRNLGRDGRMSLAVMDAETPTHWVGVKGVATLLREGDGAVADIQAMARHYGKDPTAYAGQDRVTYRITIESTFEYGADE